MLKGKVKGYIIAGENPAVGHANGKAHRLGLSRLDWLVVRDVVEIESASFWYDSPEVESGELKPEEIATEVFFLPAATHTEKDGSFTNTQRLLQWHWQAVEPKEDCRSELWFYYHLGRLIKQKLADSEEERDKLIKALRWEYPTHSAIREPDAEAVLQEVNGWEIASGKFLSGYPELKDDGSTLCGCWIYCGCFKDGDQPDGAQEAALGAGELRRARVGVGVAGEPAPHLQPRLGRSGREPVVGAQALRLVGRGRGQVDGPRRARLRGGQGARLRAARRREGRGRHRRRPPVHHAGGRPRLALRAPGARGRPAADALRAARVAVRQPALLASARTRAASRTRISPRIRTTRSPTSRAPRSIRTSSRRTG